jgi:hypothetical protein
MKGNSIKHIVAENIFATHPKDNLSKWMYGKGLICWKCQKNKSRKDGQEKMMGGTTTGIRKFVCKDCLDAKEINT